jgi:hypothetical protein
MPCGRLRSDRNQRSVPVVPRGHLRRGAFGHAARAPLQLAADAVFAGTSDEMPAGLSRRMGDTPPRWRARRAPGESRCSAPGLPWASGLRFDQALGDFLPVQTGHDLIEQPLTDTDEGVALTNAYVGRVTLADARGDQRLM